MVVVFDLVNTLLKWDPFDLIFIIFQLKDEEAKIFFEKLITSKTWEKLDRGKINESIAGKLLLPAELSNEYPKFENKHYSGFLMHYKKYFKKIDASISVLNQLHKAGVECYCLTDNVNELLSRLKINFGEVFAKFKDTIASCEQGCTKKTGELFKKFLEKTQLDAKEIIFIDDNEINIEQAEKLGMKVFLFDMENPNKLEKYLYELNILTRKKTPRCVS